MSRGSLPEAQGRRGRKRLELVALLALWCASVSAAAAGQGGIEGAFPADHRLLKRTISYEEMAAFLDSLNAPRITVTAEGATAQGRALYLVHIESAARPSWRVLLYAQQHGNEVSGKDALLYLVRSAAAEPERLPAGVDLWVMPMVNPDGAAANQRRNSAGVDLNRDHQRLSQPETQALHRVVRRVMPHVAVDCHEFTRGGKEYASRGLDEWPIIMMDGANHPFFDPAVTATGVRWVESAAPVMQRAGYNFLRYSVGGLPPDEEQRYSSPELDDGRNAIAAFGGLSFIIEAGVRRNRADPEADLGARVDAYLTLLRHLINETRTRVVDLETVEHARRTPLPPFVPTNVFWANASNRLTPFPLLDAASGATVEILTPNFMPDLVVKRSVAVPAAYAVEPAAAAVYRRLLDRHAIPFVELTVPRRARAERCRLLRVEEDYDAVYERYEGRQIVERLAPTTVELAAGSLLIAVDGPDARRTVLLLEPCQLYGLFQFPEFRWTAGADGALPVLRVLSDEDGDDDVRRR